MIEYLKTFIKSNWLTIFLSFVAPTLIWLYIQKETRELRVSIKASIPVVSLNDQYSDGVEFFYKKEKVTSLDVVEIEVSNTGNTPIRSSDFEKPLELKYNGRVIGDAKIVNQNPSELEVISTITDDGTVLIEPLLLNSEDSFVLRAYISELSQNNLAVAGRVVGVEKIEITNSDSDKNNIWLNLVLGSLIGYFFSALVRSLVAVWKFKSFKSKVRVLLKPIGILTDRDIRSEETAELANKLEIDDHDSKTNLLLIRLRIEKLLRQISDKKYGSSKSIRVSSSGRLLKLLADNDEIDKNVVSVLKEMLPILNREMHNQESFLTRSEFDSLVSLGVNVIGDLELIAASN